MSQALHAILALIGLTTAAAARRRLKTQRALLERRFARVLDEDMNKIAATVRAVTAAECRSEFGAGLDRLRAAITALERESEKPIGLYHVPREDAVQELRAAARAVAYGSAAPAAGSRGLAAEKAAEPSLGVRE